VNVLAEAGRLAAEGRPFALATVVRVERPASTQRGDRALVTPDGAVHGWVGGACSEPIVVREALRALADGEPRLVRIGPAGTPGGEGIVCAVSECASEGTVEVLIEPQRGAPVLAVVGDSPAARTLALLAPHVGWGVSGDPDGADAVVVATMGRGDEDALVRALGSDAGYVGLVSSARRAGVVAQALRDRGLGEEAVARVRSPAGLDLGPCSQEEIAVAVLAELVAWRHTRPLPKAAPDGARHLNVAVPGTFTSVAEAVDPVCGMTVSLASAVTAEHDGVTYAFCCPGCRGRFEADPARYATVPS
jgi:xanthine dehydrogenase accessory factor